MTVTLFFFPIISAIRIISRDSSPPGSVDVIPGAAEASMTLKLKLTYCASVFRLGLAGTMKSGFEMAPAPKYHCPTAIQDAEAFQSAGTAKWSFARKAH